MILVGVFVSMPFTAYVFVAGLNAIPDDVYEAARIDGATPGQTYWRVTLPLLRPALLVASVLNIIYVFNSFPIIWTLNDRNPGFAHDTTITFMYKLAFKSEEKDVGMSAAAGIFNVILILVVVVIYLRTVKWRRRELMAAIAHPAERARRPRRRSAGRSAGSGTAAGCCRSPACSSRWPSCGPTSSCCSTRCAPAATSCRPRRPSCRAWQLSTYAQVLGDERFLGWLKTSVLVAVTSTLIVILVAIPAAYFTARFRFPGRIAFLFLVLVTQMFSPTSLVVGLYREFFNLNLVNTYLALILTNAAFNLAFAVWILHGFFSSIPHEVEEAAAPRRLRPAAHPAADHAAADAARAS